MLSSAGLYHKLRYAKAASMAEQRLPATLATFMTSIAVWFQSAISARAVPVATAT
jgi:hypothetical protein